MVAAKRNAATHNMDSARIDMVQVELVAYTVTVRVFDARFLKAASARAATPGHGARGVQNRVANRSRPAPGCDGAGALLRIAGDSAKHM